MKTINTELKIYRDGQLQRWATYKPLIVPKTELFISNGHEAVTGLAGQLRSYASAFNEHMTKIANS